MTQRERQKKNLLTKKGRVKNPPTKRGKSQ